MVSDALNHASIIDGIRLCAARRYRYPNNDMAALREQLTQARADGADQVLIATDGVFSMDGVLADLPAICELADEFDALVMVDDSHAVGFVGPTGRGTPEHHGVTERVDIVTGTLGKASAVRPAGTRREGRRSSRGCGSGPGRTCSPTRWRRRSPRRRSPSSICCALTIRCARGSTPTPRGSASAWPRSASPSPARGTRSSP